LDKWPKSKLFALCWNNYNTNWVFVSQRDEAKGRDIQKFDRIYATISEREVNGERPLSTPDLGTIRKAD
jgi:hypothetical protein